MLEDFGIRSKVLAVLALPVAVLTAAGGTIVATAAAEAAEDTALHRVALSTDVLGQLTGALRVERDLSLAARAGASGAGGAGAAEGATGGAEALERARERSTALIDRSDRALTAIEVEDLSDEARDALVTSRQTLAALPDLRDEVDSPSVGDVRITTGYQGAIGALDDLPRAAALGQDDADLSTALQSWTEVQELIDLADSLEGQIGIALADQSLAQVEGTSLYTAAVRRELLRARLVADVNRLTTDVPAPETAAGLVALRQAFLASTTAPDAAAPAGLDDASVDAAISEDTAALRATADQLAAVAQDRASTLADQTRDGAARLLVLVALLVLGSLVVALLIGGSIVARLRRVTRAAERMREELPAAVAAAGTRGAGGAARAAPSLATPGRDEVGRLATALDDVTAVALDLAHGQARLRTAVSAAFVGVARRNQSLLGRQLGAIDTLEQAEQDSGSLAALFQLDHMASQMRRNAESLLVIAGEESGRRVRSPMLLSDVVRTAASEVEHYERVDLALHADPEVPARVALVLAHLLAELLENATTFSPGSTRVSVSSREPRAERPVERDAAMVVAVTDHGVGMTGDDLARARTRVRDSSHASLVDASRLGLTVVARLAERLGVAVAIDPATGGGTVVSLALPAALLGATAERGTRRGGAVAAAPARVGAADASPADVPAAASAASADRLAPVLSPAGPAEHRPPVATAPGISGAARGLPTAAARVIPGLGGGSTPGRHRSARKRPWRRRRPAVVSEGVEALMSGEMLAREGWAQLPRAGAAAAATGPVLSPAGGEGAAPTADAAPTGERPVAAGTRGARDGVGPDGSLTHHGSASSDGAGAPAGTGPRRGAGPDAPAWAPTLAYRSAVEEHADGSARPEAAAAGLPQRRAGGLRGGGHVPGQLPTAAAADGPAHHGSGHHGSGHHGSTRGGPAHGGSTAEGQHRTAPAAARERAPETVRSSLTSYRAGVVRARQSSDGWAGGHQGTDPHEAGPQGAAPEVPGAPAEDAAEQERVRQHVASGGER